MKVIFTASTILLLVAAGLASAQSGEGKLRVHADPYRAGVFVDGKYVGPAANFGVIRNYPLPAGEHEILLSDPEHQDVTQKVSVTAGATSSIRAVLEKTPPPAGPYGLLKTPNPPDKFAGVFLNGKFVGHAGEFDHSAQGVRIPAGEYEMKVVPTKGGQEHIEKIKITENQTTLVAIK